MRDYELFGTEKPKYTMRAEVSRVSTKLAARIKANCFTKSILVTAFTAKARIF